MRGWCVIVGLSAGCTPSEENWGKTLAHAQCSFAKRCDAANFWYTWDDVAACESAAVEAYDATLPLLDGCTFQPDAAKQCLQALRQDCKEVGREYNGLVAPCLEAWDCGGVARDSSDTGPLTTN